MEKLFVPYDIAVKLEAIGFNEPCFAVYNNGGILLVNYTTGQDGYYPELHQINWNVSEKDIAAPLYDQVIDWFIEKHDIWIEVGGSSSYIKCFVNDYIYEGTQKRNNPTAFNTRQEALNTGILKAIEFVKSK